MNEDILTTLKIVITGESGVGKSSLLAGFVDDTFDPNQSLTIGVDYKVKRITIDGNQVALAIWDTAGQERFRALTPNYYRDAHGAILVYDVTNHLSYLKIENWLSELETYSNKSNMIKMIVGNKIDLEEREVSTQDGIALAKKHATLFLETSAKTKSGVQHCFEELILKIIQTPGLWESSKSDIVDLNDPSRERTGYCSSCWFYKKD